MVERVAEMADAMVLHLERLAARPAGPGRAAAARHAPPHPSHPRTAAACAVRSTHPTGSSPAQERGVRRPCRASGCARPRPCRAAGTACAARGQATSSVVTCTCFQKP
jgi:hypothetical protein